MPRALPGNPIEPNDAGDRERPSRRHCLAQVDALDHLHDDERPLAIVERRRKGRQAGMGQPAEGVRLTGGGVPLGRLIRVDLDGVGGPGTQIERPEDIGEVAGA